MTEIDIHGEIVEFWPYRRAMVHSAIVIRVPNINDIVREYLKDMTTKWIITSVGKHLVAYITCILTIIFILVIILIFVLGKIQNTNRHDKQHDTKSI